MAARFATSSCSKCRSKRRSLIVVYRTATLWNEKNELAAIETPQAPSVTYADQARGRAFTGVSSMAILPQMPDESEPLNRPDISRYEAGPEDFPQ
jgi:hypothetical protein